MQYDMLFDELEHKIDTKVSGGYERSLTEIYERRAVENQLIDNCVQELVCKTNLSEGTETFKCAYEKLVRLRVDQKMHDTLLKSVVEDCREFLESADPSDYWTSTMVKRLLEFSREYSADALKYYQSLHELNEQKSSEIDPVFHVVVLWAKFYKFLRHKISNRKRRGLYTRILNELEGREMERHVDYEDVGARIDRLTGKETHGEMEQEISI